MNYRIGAGDPTRLGAVSYTHLTMEEYGEEGYQDLIIDSKVLADNDCWFSLDLVLYQGAGSG